jgi:Family of unknown function (DUF6459)
MWRSWTLLGDEQCNQPATPRIPARECHRPRVQLEGMPETSPRRTAIRQVTVPLAAPPYDDERGGNDSASIRRPAPRRGTSADWHPTARPARDKPGPARPPDPDPHGWPTQFAQVLAETLAGSRPARQLTPWTTDQTRRQLRQLGAVLASSERPKVRRVMTSAPAGGVLEVTAVVGFGPRVRVLALRLERDETTRGRWCCTAIDSA